MDQIVTYETNAIGSAGQLCAKAIAQGGVIHVRFSCECWQFFDWCAAHGLELTSERSKEPRRSFEQISQKQKTLRIGGEVEKFGFIPGKTF